MDELAGYSEWHHRNLFEQFLSSLDLNSVLLSFAASVTVGTGVVWVAVLPWFAEDVKRMGSVHQLLNWQTTHTMMLVESSAYRCFESLMAMVNGI